MKLSKFMLHFLSICLKFKNKSPHIKRTFYNVYHCKILVLFTLIINN
nr:MAG TPA: hypothetical protein [Caudoviricetes sp.]